MTAVHDWASLKCPRQRGYVRSLDDIAVYGAQNLGHAREGGVVLEVAGLLALEEEPVTGLREIEGEAIHLGENDQYGRFIVASIVVL